MHRLTLWRQQRHEQPAKRLVMTCLLLLQPNVPVNTNITDTRAGFGVAVGRHTKSTSEAVRKASTEQESRSSDNDLGHQRRHLCRVSGNLTIANINSAFTLDQSNPIQSNPIQSNPIQSNPIQSNPIQSNPIQSASH
jgi:hypothetical protein